MIYHVLRQKNKQTKKRQTTPQQQHQQQTKNSKQPGFALLKL